MKIRRGILVLFAVACAAFIACSGGGNKNEESTSQGSLVIYCDEYILQLMQAETAAYESVNPQAHLSLVPATARDAVIALLSGKTKLAVLGRALLDAERNLVNKYNIQVGEYEIAKDALAVIVNKKNPVDTIGVSTLKTVLLDQHESWRAMGTRFDLPITTVVPKPGSSAYENIVSQITGEQLKTANIVCDSAEQVVRAVRAYAGAVGFTDWDLVSEDTTVKILRIAADTGNLAGRPVLLHPAYIYLKRYPLLHSVYGYTTEGKPELAKGFMVFVCTAAGQRIALDQKLVPVTQIIRLKEPD